MTPAMKLFLGDLCVVSENELCAEVQIKGDRFAITPCFRAKSW